MRLSFCSLAALAALSSWTACGDDDKKPADTADTADTTDTADSAPDTAEPDTSEPDTSADTADTAEPDTSADTADSSEPDTTPVYEKPAHFPDRGDADEVLVLDGVTAPVRVVYDDRGIPHIYGADRKDVSFVQGYVIARDRIFQMHTLRSASKGRLAEYAGVSSLAGDVLLRMLKLGSVAAKMAQEAPTKDPELTEAMDAYTAGVNAFLARMREGKEVAPPEVTIFGMDLIYDWSNADTMAIARLQTWDLGFGGIVDELTLWEVVETLREQFAGTPLEGIELDVSNFEPTAETATLEPEGGASQVGEFDLGAVLDQPFFRRTAQAALARQVRAGFDAMGDIPHRFFRGSDKGAVPGSNNWVVSGQFTESGRPIVSNDTHLSLRNPAIFYHVQLSDKLAGGDLNVGGVQFAGAPGVVLGHNDHAAWGATVFYSDVTDFYVERVDPTKSKVWFKGAWVDLVPRVEAFEFTKPGAVATCLEAAPAYLTNLATSEREADGRCHIEATVLDVPHHGPIIPWSFRASEDGSGEYVAVSWRWTGFEATEDLGAVHRLATVTDFESFKAALQKFQVGAQNWIFGGTDGDIGWYPSHDLPIRANIAAGDYRYPPFLPMPGDTGDNEWAGMLPREQIPQAHNPAQGFIATANADPVGRSFDNDPFNDGPYIGYAWDVGYRVAQITRRLQSLFARSSSKITPADMSSVQGDHRSNLGADLAPHIVAAVDACAASDDPALRALVTEQVRAAADLLRDWADTDYLAADGVVNETSPAQLKASQATSIFNAFLPALLRNIATDKGNLGIDRLGQSMAGRFLFRLFAKPETMHASVDAIWDNTTTADHVETRDEAITKSLAETVAFLRNPLKVGVAQQGGFGTDDMSQWLWASSTR